MKKIQYEACEQEKLFNWKMLHNKSWQSCLSFATLKKIKSKKKEF